MIACPKHAEEERRIPRKELNIAFRLSMVAGTPLVEVRSKRSEGRKIEEEKSYYKIVVKPKEQRISPPA